MKIAIVDDEKAMRDQLSEYVTRYAGENHAALEPIQFSSGDALLACGSAALDMIIFDIDMPGTNGLDAARKIRAQDDHVVILFVTNIAQYAINGYEVDAVDYIIKPIGYYDFSMKFQRAMLRVVRTRAQQLVLYTTDGVSRVDVSEVLYVEVLDHNLLYHTRDQTYRVRGSMKEHEGALREHHFSRTHKSYMVNLRRIDNIKPSVVMAGGAAIPLGRAYKDALMADYLQFLGG